MAGLVIKTSVSRNEDGSEIYIEFVDATGLYSTENPGGFGMPNPTRNMLAVIFLGLHKTVAEDISCIPNIYNPLTVTSFTIPLTREVNGHLKYNLFMVPIFNNVGVYAEGDIVYDNENPIDPFIKKYVAGIWIRLSNADLQGSILIQKNGNAFPVPAVEKFRNKLNAQRVQAARKVIKKICGHEEYEELKLHFDYVDGILEIAVNGDFCGGAFAEAQIKIEDLMALENQLNG